MYDFLEVNIAFVQGVPLATEPVISLIILTPMKILQRNFEQEYRHILHFSHNERTPVQISFAISSLVLELLTH